MPSVASEGAAERMAARIFCNVLRAGSATRARYSSTVFGTRLDFNFFMRGILRGWFAQVQCFWLNRGAPAVLGKEKTWARCIVPLRLRVILPEADFVAVGVFQRGKHACAFVHGCVCAHAF